MYASTLYRESLAMKGSNDRYDSLAILLCKKKQKTSLVSYETNVICVLVLVISMLVTWR